jgi:hypothetical protein
MTRMLRSLASAHGERIGRLQHFGSGENKNRTTPANEGFASFRDGNPDQKSMQRPFFSQSP